MSNAEADDRWSKFVDTDIKAANRNTGRVATEKTKGFNEYLTRVLIQKPHRQIQEYLYKVIHRT
ncbi:hypothetical protein DPMN_148581 [Dreissena polymorpha]|uniref:Uncharacterized protein n=1 Tax=Dreissena polymorpha TaxID=45954 RepID=A0A9D4J0C5_DREPO|nr:hypothetical protein DPMN_148581 [Dreissena polymorpha]